MYMYMYMYVNKTSSDHLHAHVKSVIGTRQHKTDNSLFTRKSCLRRDLNPQHTAYHVGALPTEPPRQLSWAGQIFKVYAKAKASLP